MTDWVSMEWAHPVPEKEYLLWLEDDRGYKGYSLGYYSSDREAWIVNGWANQDVTHYAVVTPPET